VVNAIFDTINSQCLLDIFEKGESTDSEHDQPQRHPNLAFHDLEGLNINLHLNLIHSSNPRIRSYGKKSIELQLTKTCRRDLQQEVRGVSYSTVL